MRIRHKLFAIVIPLIIAPLAISGLVAAYSTRTEVTSLAQAALRFKAEELRKYAEAQWQLLVANDLSTDAEFVRVAQEAVESYARGLVRSDTELILAIDRSGSVAMATRPVDVRDGEAAVLQRIADGSRPAWQIATIGGTNRVTQPVTFEPFGWTLLVTEHESVFFAVVQRIYRQTAIVLAAALAVSLALLVPFTTRLLRPLGAMALAMRRTIESNDLSERVDILYRDEIGDLGHTFNLMTDQLDRAYSQIRQHAFDAIVARRMERKIRNVFQKYVPADVIDRVFQNPESMLVGENRDLAVLFADIRGFTTIAERLAPDRMVESLNAYFTLMVDAILDQEGVVDKYIGDAIMAFFGAPVTHDDDPLRAVNAGLAMLDALRRFNSAQASAGQPPFRIGIGISYGTVTIGNIGTDKKMDYTVVGDMVNLASRLEGLTKQYHVPFLISERIADAVGDSVPCRLIDTVTVKGKLEATRIYEARRSLSPDESRAWELYRRGIENYYHADFTTAARYLLAARKLLPNDRNTLLFLLRCKEFRKNPPAPDWNGVITVTEK